MTTAIRPTDDEWLSAKEVAHMLGMSTDGFYNARSNGEKLPPVYKPGKYLRFRKSEVDAFLLQSRELTAETQLAQSAPAAAPTPSAPAPARMAPKPWEVRA